MSLIDVAEDYNGVPCILLFQKLPPVLMLRVIEEYREDREMAGCSKSSASMYVLDHIFVSSTERNLENSTNIVQKRRHLL